MEIQFAQFNRLPPSTHSQDTTAAPISGVAASMVGVALRESPKGMLSRGQGNPHELSDPDSDQLGDAALWENH
jgi:hypothetical protein